jgi:hypothetical protein
MQNKTLKTIIYLLILIALSVFGYFRFQYYQNETTKPSLEKASVTQEPAEISEPSPKANLPTQVEIDYQTVTKVNPQDDTKTDIYIKISGTDKEIFLMTLTDVYREHFHNSEFKNDTLYIIRRVGDSEYPSDDWTDELWKYDSNENGKKLFSSKGLTFLVSPNQASITVVFNDELFFIDSQGNHLKQFSSTDFAANPSERGVGLGILEWSADSQTLWGQLAFGPVPNAYFEIDTATWQLNKHDLSTLDIGSEKVLNTETRKIAYSNHPVFFDVNSSNDFKTSKKEVTLYLHDFTSKETIEIATSKAKGFNPMWQGNNKIQYDNPQGQDQLTYSL